MPEPDTHEHGRQSRPSKTRSNHSGRPAAPTPKRPRTDTAGMADIFPYYAGFSYEWACKFLRDEIGSRMVSPTILDPWNGSGTTTLAAQANGYSSIGVDLNPIANIIAQLKVSIRREAEPCKPPVMHGELETLHNDDPLLAWFSRRTAVRLRAWSTILSEADKTVSALGFVSLFRLIRRITDHFEGSNPTWVRKPRDGETMVDVEPEHLDKMIVEEQERLIARLREQPYRESSAGFVTASATALPLASGSIDAILTSPPYLTRIDYAVAYSRELAVLGLDAFGDRRFRAELMGTTLIRPSLESNDLPYGSIARKLVESISGHTSKASSGYYKKQVIQYLDDLTRSLDEISRVASNCASLIMVVQDSYYKEIPIRLAAICIEEGRQRGWVLHSEKPEEVSRSIVQFNKAARAYPKGRVCETVISLRKCANG